MTEPVACPDHRSGVSLRIRMGKETVVSQIARKGPHPVATWCAEVKRHYEIDQCFDARCVECFGDEARDCTELGCDVDHVERRCEATDGDQARCSYHAGHYGAVHREVRDGSLWAEWRSVHPDDEPPGAQTCKCIVCNQCRVVDR